MSNSKSELNYKPLISFAEVDPESLPFGTPSNFTFKYIDIASANNGKLVLPNDFLEYKDAPSRARRVLRNGDVIMSTVRPNLKAFAYCSLPKDHFIASTGFAVLRAKEGVDPRFILYSILSDDVSQQIGKCAVGSNYPAINSSDVRRLQISNFSSLHQQRIAEILSTVDEAIEQTEALIAKTQQIKAGLMHDLFTRGVTPDGKLRPPRDEAPHLYKKSPLGWIPKEWDSLSMRDASKVNQGLQIAISNRFNSGGKNRHLYLTIKFLNDTTAENDTYYIEETNAAVICTYDDVLLVRTGNTGAVVTEVAGVFHNNFFKIDYNRSLLKRDFLVYHLRRQIIQTMILNYAGTTTIPDLKHKDFYSLPISVPSSDEQTLISQRIRQVESRIHMETDYKNKLIYIKSGLMHDLLTGNVRVPSATTPEIANPA